MNSPTERHISRPMKGLRACAAVLLAVSVLGPGCGFIADKDRIVVATLNGKNITRGDLSRVIREMSDEERPIIQNKGDLLRTLNRYIDDEIKKEIAAELKGTDKISVDRDLARQVYFTKYPEFQRVNDIQDPSALDMTEGDIVAVKAEVEFGVDDEEELLLREEALRYKTQEAVQTGRVQISPQELELEYELKKDELSTFELVEFIGLRFPVEAPGAVEAAAAARRRLDAGESFDALLETFIKLNPALAMRSALENNPTNDKFRTFWTNVTGCSVGDIIGPVLLPAYDQVAQRPDGTAQVQQMPAAFIVLEVVDHAPAHEKSIEDAQLELAMSIVQRKIMEVLRAERGVEVFPENLPRPEGYGDQFEGQFIDTGI